MNWSPFIISQSSERYDNYVVMFYRICVQYFGQTYPSLSGPIWTYLNSSEPIQTNINLSEPIWTHLNQSEPIWTKLNQSEPRDPKKNGSTFIWSKGSAKISVVELFQKSWMYILKLNIIRFILFTNWLKWVKLAYSPWKFYVPRSEWKKYNVWSLGRWFMFEICADHPTFKSTCAQDL